MCLSVYLIYTDFYTDAHLARVFSTYHDDDDESIAAKFDCVSQQYVLWLCYVDTLTASKCSSDAVVTFPESSDFNLVAVFT